ncbi:MAG: hypothetical protein QXQ70_08695 [Candidatus Caldarchaeum sp.]
MRAVFSRFSCSKPEKFHTTILKLRNIITGSETSFTAVIDTGFDGYIMLTHEAYQSMQLSLSEASEDEFPVYRTMAGTVVFRKSIAEAELSGITMLTEVITPKHGMGKNLVGRRLLQHFTTLLHKNEKSCVGEAELTNGLG